MTNIANRILIPHTLIIVTILFLFFIGMSQQNQLLLIKLTMDIPNGPLKIQLRLGQCRMKLVAAPAQYSVVLVKDRTSSQNSPWKSAKDNSCYFNCFLRIRSQQLKEDQQCFINLYSRSQEIVCLIGQASVHLNVEKMEKMRKYPVKDQSKSTIAIIEASFYVKANSDSLSGISCKSNFSSSGRQELNEDFGQILSHFKLNSPEHDDQSSKRFTKESKEPQKGVQKVNTSDLNQSKAANIANVQNLLLKLFEENKNNRELSVNRSLMSNNKSIMDQSVNPEFDAYDAQQLLMRLFEEIGKKDAVIDKKQAELHQKQAEIRHIRMKQLASQRDERKIQRLKKRTEFLLATNDMLAMKDDHQDEQLARIKRQKEQIIKQNSKKQAETTVKISFLMSELEDYKEKAEGRCKKVNSLFEQIDSYVREINELKQENREKSKIINFLKNELSAIQINQQTKNCGLKTNQIDRSNKVFEKKSPSSNLLSNIRQIDNMPKSQIKIKRSKTLTLFRRNTTEPKSIQKSKGKFDKSKKILEKQTNKSGNIFDYILKLAVQKRMS